MTIKKYIELIENVVREATTEFKPKPHDPALMTMREYLKFRNEGGKMHPESAYDSTLERMNDRFGFSGMLAPNLFIDRKRCDVLENYAHEDEDKKMYGLLSSGSPRKLYAFWHKGTIHYDPMVLNQEGLDTFERILTGNDVTVTQKKKEKYIRRILEKLKVPDYKKLYPKFIKRIVSKGEEFTVRENGEKDIAVINSEGYKVAAAQDEWGCVLVHAAREYRGYGLGQLLQRLYTDTFPDKPSGGFTRAGEYNAMKVWAERVREYMANGFYSQLVVSGTLSKEKVKNIIDGLPDQRSSKEVVAKRKEVESPDYRLFHDGRSFILYDSKFLDNQDEDYVYAFSMLNDTNEGETFIYRLEYDERVHEKIVFYATLQMHTDKGDKIKADFAGGDYIEEDFKYVDVEDGYFVLSKQVLPNLDRLIAVEAKLRKAKDEYNEIHDTLLEIANSKWD